MGTGRTSALGRDVNWGMLGYGLVGRTVDSDREEKDIWFDADSISGIIPDSHDFIFTFSQSQTWRVCVPVRGLIVSRQRRQMETARVLQLQSDMSCIHYVKRN